MFPDAAELVVATFCL